MTTLISALLPIVVTISLGFFAGWHKDFSQEQSSVLNRMVMLYALPMSLIAGILTIKRADLLANLPLFMWLFLAMIGGYFLFLLFFRFILKNDIGIAALRALSISGPAIPFIGTSVLTTLFNAQEASLTVAIGSILMNLIQVPITIMLLSVSSKKDQKSSLMTSIKSALAEPVVWAPIASFILVLLGFELPTEFKESFMLLGQSTSGVALFASGAILFAQKVSISKDVVLNVLSKNILVPLVLMFLMIWTSNTKSLIDLVTITMAIPTASIPVILSVQYQTYEKETSSTLFFSTILSVVSMGCLIVFLK